MRSIYWLSGGVVGLAGVSSALFICSAPSVAEDQPPQLELKGVIRDFVPDSGNPDFSANPSQTPGAKSAKNIAMELDDAHKPVYVGNGKKVDHEWKDCKGNVIGWCQPPITQPSSQADDPGDFAGQDNGAINSAATFSQWFRDVPGVNSSRLWTLTLNWVTNDNRWGPHYKFSTNDFSPLVDPAADDEDSLFTYEIAANFTYHAADNQFLWYKGSEDVWVFINDKLM